MSLRPRQQICAALGVALAASAAGAAPEEQLYELGYDVRIVPTERAARVAIRIESPDGLVLSVRLRNDPERYRDFEGDGDLEVSPEAVTWSPPAGAAELRYAVRIDHLRDERTYDARCAEDWAIFRGEDLVPPARVRTLKGARSRARLRLRVPKGWSVAAPYARGEGERFELEDPERGFDRPEGWFAVGRLGVLRESVSGVHVAVAGPVGQRLRRLDILALLRWTLPELKSIVPLLPGRLVVVGAGDPMWRGALSGPRSAFVHVSRPLLTEDGTSPVLHELMHSVLGIRGAPGADWIVEGLAELYSMELLVRSGTVSRKRFERSLARMEQRGKQATSLDTDRAAGAVTARAVGVLRALDGLLREASDGARGLDDVVRALAEQGGEVTTARLQALAEEIGGAPLSGFFSRVAPGAPAGAPGA